MKSFPSILIIKATALLFFQLVCAGEVFSFQSTFVPVNESKLWIEGSSNVNEFECTAEDYTGFATLPETSHSSTMLNAANHLLSLKIDIQVKSFECGKERMNQDLQDALKADSFPEITFIFKSAVVLRDYEEETESFLVRVNGLLTVAGTTKEIHFNTQAYYNNSRRVRAVGQTTINMIDFGVEPPTALMGLIKAHKKLTVNFDLIAKPTNVR